MSDDPAKPPRFPYVAALLCAACVGAAAWTWMRYSYCWDVEPLTFSELTPPNSSWSVTNLHGRYVRVSGSVMNVQRGRPNAFPDVPMLEVRDRQWPRLSVVSVIFPDSADLPCESGGHATFIGRAHALFSDEDREHFWNARPSTKLNGRVVLLDPMRFGQPIVDTTASRWHGASIAGLVVGAMGVFVFTVALRHWLGERRKFREEERA